MQTQSTLFTHWAFWMLVVFSLILPFGIYGSLLRRRTISKVAVLIFGLAMVIIAGVDVYLLQTLATAAKQTPTLADDAIFVSELSTALYLLPAMFGGIGINIVSHVLLRSLSSAERRFEKQHLHD